MNTPKVSIIIPVYQVENFLERAVDSALAQTLELFQSGEAADTEQVLLVSSDFHLTRIQMLWNRASGGGDTLSTLAAPVSHFPSRVQMFFREPFALVKSFLFDR